MIKKALSLTCLTILASAGLRADFSYEQASKVTGGVMAGMMKMAGALSQNAREAGNVTVMVKGDRMAHLNANTGTVIDLGKETITEINFRGKTYSVVTFAQMAQYIDQMSKKMQQGGKAEMNFKASVKETGQSKQIAGFPTREVVLTLEMQSTDQASGNKGSMNVISDMWLAKDIAGYGEVRAFQQRMAQKLAWTPGASAFTQGRADMAKGFADLQKEGAQLDGVPVLQVVSMTMAGEGQPGQPGQPSQPVAKKEEAPAPSIGGALGRLGGLGGLAGLGRRKKEEPKAEEQPAPAAASSGAPGALMETTTEFSAFSTAPVDAAKFEVPAGFRQVESEMVKGLK
jgi:carbon monoxide dehydrogenase subunit G